MKAADSTFSTRPADGVREWAGNLLIIFFTLPLVLTHVSGFEIQAAMLVAPLMLLPALVQLRMTATTTTLVAAALLSIVSIVYVGIVHTGRLDERSVLSFLFFYLPYTYYFIGWRFIKTEQMFAHCLRVISLSGAVLGIAVLGKSTLRGDYIRVFGCIDDRCGSYMLGDFLGLPIYASFGVNSLAAIYCLLALICSAHVLFKPMNKWTWLELAGALCLTGLVLGSASRSAVLSLFVGLLVLAFFYQTGNSRAKLIGLSAIAFAGAMISLTGVASGIMEQYLGYRVDATMDLIASGDVQGATSNRVDLFLTAVEQVAESPLFGTGFQGFGFSGAGYNIESSSAHLQALTIVWKTGVLAGLVLFYFYFRALRVFSDYFKRSEMRLVRNLCLALITTILVQSLVWDVVLVPWIGGLLLFTLGAVQGIESSRPAPVAQRSRRRRSRGQRLQDSVGSAARQVRRGRPSAETTVTWKSRPELPDASAKKRSCAQINFVRNTYRFVLADCDAGDLDSTIYAGALPTAGRALRESGSSVTSH